MDHRTNFRTLDAAAKLTSAQAILETADLRFLLWPDGEIARASLCPVALRGKKLREPEDLMERPIADIACGEDGEKLMVLVREARDGRKAPAVRVRHSALIGRGGSAMYSAHLAANRMQVVLIGTRLDIGMDSIEQTARAEIDRYEHQTQRATTARYRDLFQMSVAGLLLADPQNGVILDASPAMTEVVGLSWDRIVGRSLDALFKVTGGGPKMPTVARIIERGSDVRIHARAMDRLFELTLTVLSYAGRESLVARVVEISQDAAPRPTTRTSRASEDMVEMIGEVPMRSLVRDSTDTIERECIAAALRLTGGNRTATAKVLGLSRQTLYAKLRQFGM